ncbi:unnamed protein product [Haemonchus placei]|uniref:Serine protease K12H4.7 n=1 Tax=Haemonchus placei TaxID=6290 RepID=A0A158QJP5_HAEPC|nr:unnamed protein product [Haemonchus placei]
MAGMSANDTQIVFKSFASQGGFSGREAYLKQKLDHFQENKEWSQRYFYNNRYYRKGGNVAFLMLGGTGVLDMEWVTDEKIPFVQFAKERGALMFALEHRFYGKSRPTEDLSVKNLQYLNSRQAIEDIATFIQTMNNKFKLNNPKWIVFGGSYAGSLALWARQKYPEMITGAVGSSPLMEPRLDFWEASQLADKVYRNSDPKCAENIKIGFLQMMDMLGNETGRSQLSELFKTEPRSLTPDLRNIQLFTSIQLNNFLSAVQYRGGPYMQNGTHSFNVESLCGMMNNDKFDQIRALERINSIRVIQSKYLSDMQKNTPVDFDALVKYLVKKDFDEEGWASVDRATLWQRCTEFGSFPTTDGDTNNIFGSLVSLDFYVDLCRVFGEEFDAEYIEKAIEKTLQYYGGADGYNGTNVLIPNGGSDPWHLLSKLSSEDPTVVTYLIEGGSHCADMFPSEVRDVPDAERNAVKEIQQLIAQNIDSWISDIPSPFYLKKKEPEEYIVRRKVSVPANRVPPSKDSKSKFKLSKRQPTRASTIQLSSKGESNNPQAVRLGRHSYGFIPNRDKLLDIPAEFESGYFTQPVDHFNNKNPATFEQEGKTNSNTTYTSQRYFKNEQWAKPDGPSFLMIGGNSPIHLEWVLNENYTYLQWAKKFGATVYLLEHRYYGESDLLTTWDESTDITLKKNYLTYLSSLQMLHDVANFIENVDAENGKRGKWIAFGRSYAGSLALWMRELFPDLVHGAVGSSAPLEAKMDFYEYYQVIEASIRNYSEACAYSIATGNAHGHGIPELCHFMERSINETRTPLGKLASFNRYMTEFHTGAPFKYTFNSYKDFVASSFQAQFSKDRRDVALSGQLESQCQKFCLNKLKNLWAHERHIISKRLIAHNYEATNVVMTHGSLDPWKALGKVKCEETDNCFMIGGAGHCAEMYPAQEEDSPQLSETRSKIEKIIGEWVGQHNSNNVDEEQRPPNVMDTKFPFLVIGKNPGKHFDILDSVMP